MLSPCDITSEKPASLCAVEELISPGQIQVECITQFDELLALRSVWDDLLAQYPAATFFLNHAWVCEWWRCFGAPHKLFLLVLKHHGKIIGIAPFMQSLWFVHGIPVRRISFFHNRHTLRGDTLFPVAPQMCVQAMLDYLKQRQGEWDELYWANVPASSTLYCVAPDCAAQQGLSFDPWEPGRKHNALPITDTWQDYLMRRTRHFRKSYNNMRNRLNGLGHLELEHRVGRSAMLQVLPELFDLERRSWHGQDQDVAMSDADREFHRRLIERLPEDEGQIYLLRLEGRAIAAVILLQKCDTLYAVTTYHDADLRSASPGTMLFFDVFKSIWEQRNFKEMDFNGDTDFIRHWQPETRQHYSMRIYSSRPYGRFLRVTRRAIRYATGLFRRPLA
jgi:CelD/BcsL family acetyltransferase involved in cellulose biosynthesis